MKKYLRKLPVFLQKYTIFNKKYWLLSLPILLTVLIRIALIQVYDFSPPAFSILHHIFLPFGFDIAIFLVGSLLFSLNFSKLYFYLFNIYLLLSNLMFVHHIRIYSKPPGIGAISVLIETTPQEAVEFTKIMSLTGILATIAIAIPPFIGAVLSRPAKFGIKLKLNSLLAVSLILFVFVSIHYCTISTAKMNYINDSYLYSEFKNIFNYSKEYFLLKKLRKKRDSFTFHAQQKEELKSKQQTHVVIIGESLSRNHMSIYGYPRNTTPQLEKIEDLIVFRQVISPCTQTRSSIVRSMTLAFGLNVTNFYERGSIITALNDAQYKTFWLSNQQRYGISDTETSVIADDSDQQIFTNTEWASNSLDKKLIPKLEKILSDTAPHKFIVIHLLGNHFEYRKRYPPEQGYRLKDTYNFPPHNSADEIETINQYDASVRYTDEVVAEIINMIKKEEKYASVLFFSDHGEDLFDDNRSLLGHGSPYVSRYTIEIPFLLWISPEYINLRQLSIDEERTHTFYNNGNLFHSIADLTGLTFDDLDLKRSIFSIDVSSNQYPFIINSNNKKINYFDLKKSNK